MLRERATRTVAGWLAAMALLAATLLPALVQALSATGGREWFEAV